MIPGIPDREEPEKFSLHAFIDSPLVEVTSDMGIRVKLEYPLRGMEHAVQRCLMRREVLEKLLEAGSYLPEGIFLQIWDAWRPFALQKELYKKYSRDIIAQFCLQNASEAEQKKAISAFVSVPEEDRCCPPVHTTGGAVDVTLIDREGKELEMGTSFDAFSERTHTSYFEQTDEEVIKKNRRLLYHAMTKAGFTNLPSEWWHYDYGDRFWAFYSKQPAIYDGVFTLGEVTKA